MNMSKRFVPGVVVLGTLVALLSAAGGSVSRAAAAGDPFVVLMQGIIETHEGGPNLGLSGPDLKAGSHLEVPLYAVSGIPGTTDGDKRVGTFYLDSTPVSGPLGVYHIPGGSFSARFTGAESVVEPDGDGGFNVVGTAELEIVEATGVYRSFVHGHLHMEFVEHMSAEGVVTEYCFCTVSH